MRYVAMWNMPGYLPEMEPASFDTFGEARDYILYELGLIADVPECDPRERKMAEEAIRDLKGWYRDSDLHSDYWLAMVGDYAYSIGPDNEDDESEE